MFKRTGFMQSIAAALQGNRKLSKAPAPKFWGGVGPKKGMLSYHRDIEKSKLSRYPKPHQGARECARRRGQLRQ